MFGLMSWGELLILVIVGLIILGPDRLPGVIKTVVGFIKMARSFVEEKSEKIKDEMGPELASLREPLAEFNKLRDLHPKNIVSQHILGGKTFNDFIGADELKNTVAELSSPYPVPRSGTSSPASREASKEILAGEVPPFDVDAT